MHYINRLNFFILFSTCVASNSVSSSINDFEELQDVFGEQSCKTKLKLNQVIERREREDVLEVILNSSDSVSMLNRVSTPNGALRRRRLNAIS